MTPMVSIPPRLALPPVLQQELPVRKIVRELNDLIERVKGVGEGNAVKFSAEGLTVGGAGFKGVAAAPAAAAAKKD